MQRSSCRFCLMRSTAYVQFVQSAVATRVHSAEQACICSRAYSYSQPVP